MSSSLITIKIGTTHLDPNCYKDPLTFEPDRFAAPREEDSKEAFAFLGWGVGESTTTHDDLNPTLP